MMYHIGWLVVTTIMGNIGLFCILDGRTQPGLLLKGYLVDGQILIETAADSFAL